MATVLASCANRSDPQGVIVPLRVIHIQGQPIPTVQVQVPGGRPLTVIVDTGATGLVFFPHAISASLVKAQPGIGARLETFDGTLLSGRLGHATVTLGGVSTSKPITLAVMDTAKCASAQPSCLGDTGLQQLKRITGIVGVMGLGLAQAGELYSPLDQLPPNLVTSHSISLGPGSAGQLVLGGGPPPTGAPTRASTIRLLYLGPHPNGTAAWEDRNVKVCWTVGSHQPVCLGTILDTGANASILPTGRFSALTTTTSQSLLESGTNVALSLPGAKRPLWSFSSGLREHLVSVQPVPFASTGVDLFYSNTVTYNEKSGTITVTSR